MAPEQAKSQVATAAADWYSVGVLIYETLSGRLPFSGSAVQLLVQKISQEPPPLSPQERSRIPEDLYALCIQLLSREPAARPTGAQVLARIRQLATQLGVPPWSPARSDFTQDVGPAGYRQSSALREEGPLIGRTQQLAELSDAFAKARRGGAVVALCHGESGAGKSALCKRFLRELMAREPEVVVLSGRCYAHEDVPFKALDGVVDSLSRFLSGRPRDELEALLPRDILATARLFPVLLQISALQSTPPRRIGDELQERQAASAALATLMSRLAARRPVVLYIDDLQWGDADGISLLLDLLQPSEPPPLLLIIAYRSDEEASSVALTRLRSGLSEMIGQRISLVDIPVAALSPQEAAELALRVLPPGAQERAAIIATESGGNPFFVTELSRSYEAVEHVSGTFESRPITQLTLDALIRARVARLPPAPRRLLSAIAVAGQPIARTAVALAAYEEAAATDEPQALALLRGERLIRVRHAQSGDATPREEISIYHDRIREAVVAGMPQADCVAQHLRLAQALLTIGHAEPDQMVFHLEHGGDLDGAARYAVQASAQAYHALAYHQTVRLCRSALSYGKLSPADSLVVKARLADALVGAGHPQEAAQTYLELSQHEPEELSFKRRRQAVKQFFISGHVREAHKVLEELLPAVSLRIHKTSLTRSASLVFYQLRILANGLDFVERTEAEIPPFELRRMDTCEAIATSTAVNPVLAANFWMQFLYYSLRAGEPHRIVVAMTGAAGFLFAFGAPPWWGEKLLARAKRIAERHQYSFGIGRGIFIHGQRAQLEGRWQQSLDLVHQATEIIRGGCMDAKPLIDFMGFVDILTLRWMGVFQTLNERFHPYLKDAIERGRISHELNVRLLAGFLLALREDAPERALAFVQAAEQRLPPDASLAHLFAIDAALHTLLYQGRGREAWQLLCERRAKLESAGMLRINLFWTVWQSLQAQVALSAEEPLKLVEEAAKKLTRSRCVFGVPLSKLYRALVRKRQGQRFEALSLVWQAEEELAACDMPLHAMSVRYRRGQWLGGSAGEKLQREARDWMAEQAVRNPDRMFAMLAPDSS